MYHRLYLIFLFAIDNVSDIISFETCEMVSSENDLIDETIFKNLKAGVQLPSPSWHWFHHVESKTASCINFQNTGNGVTVYKALQVISTNKLSIQMGGRNVSFPKHDGTYDNFDQITRFIKEMEDRRPCRGILNGSLSNVTVTGKACVVQHGDVLRSQRCMYMAMKNSSNDLCLKCAAALKLLRKRALQPKNFYISKQKLKAANQKIRRMKTREMVTPKNSLSLI